VVLICGLPKFREADEVVHVAFSPMASLRTVIPFHWFTVLPALAVGVMGVLDDSWLRQALTSWANIHTLFGALLLLSVLAQFAWHVGHAAFVNTAEIAVHARSLSRQIYLLLYTLAAVKEIQFLWTSYGSGTSVDSGASVGALADFMKSFQAYVACGILALLAVRILAALRLHVLIARARRLHQE
jgi:cytochrome b561